MSGELSSKLRDYDRRGRIEYGMDIPELREAADKLDEQAAELTRLRSENAELAHPEPLGWRSETIKRDGRPGVAITFDRHEDMHKFRNWLMRNVEISRPSGGGK